jgi:DNA-binding NtrC family response regulator
MGTSARVLIVDDDDIVRLLLTHALAEYELTSADSKRSALAALESASFDAVVTDKNLPDGDGFEICTAARRLNPDAALVVLTGYASSRSAEEFLRLDVDDYIAKPFDVDHLQSRLRAALRMRRGTASGRTKAAATVSRQVLLVEPDDSDRGALVRVLERLGCEVVVAKDALAALESEASLQGALVNRRLCTEDVKAQVMQHKMRNPAFRLVVTVDSRALNETVASILVGAVGQLARPISEDEARTTLAAIFGPSV